MSEVLWKTFFLRILLNRARPHWRKPTKLHSLPILWGFSPPEHLNHVARLASGCHPQDQDFSSYLFRRRTVLENSLLSFLSSLLKSLELKAEKTLHLPNTKKPSWWFFAWKNNILTGIFVPRDIILNSYLIIKQLILAENTRSFKTNKRSNPEDIYCKISSV